uniref:Uncharacterized protein n=1 Tax=Alexandrium monilatum TaxID=311494 RepID=A0A7S4QDF1_9DINO
MAVSGIDQLQFKAMLESLRQRDQDIVQIVAYSEFVVASVLQQDGPKPEWRRANVEGPVYIVRRSTAPRYQLLVRNQLRASDLLDGLHSDWEVECQKHYVFYKVQDPTERIRGLWFRDDVQRQKIEATLEKTLEDLRAVTDDRQTEPMPAPPEVKAAPAQPGPAPQAPVMPPTGKAQADASHHRFGFAAPGEGATQETAPLSLASVRPALHALADDDVFLGMFLRKLKSIQAR